MDEHGACWPRSPHSIHVGTRALRPVRTLSVQTRHRSEQASALVSEALQGIHLLDFCQGGAKLGWNVQMTRSEEWSKLSLCGAARQNEPASLGLPVCRQMHHVVICDRWRTVAFSAPEPQVQLASTRLKRAAAMTGCFALPPRVAYRARMCHAGSQLRQAVCQCWLRRACWSDLWPRVPQRKCWTSCCLRCCKR